MPTAEDVRLPRGFDPRGRTRSLLSRLLAVVSVLVLLGSAAGYAAVRYYAGQLTRLSVNLPQAGAAGPPGTENFLLVGSDTRAGSPQFQAKPGSPQYVTGQRSDTMIFIHLPPTGAATMVSLPRDSWVQIPAYRQPDGQVLPAHYDKMNAAFAEGGPTLLVQLVEQLTGMRVDHYLQVDFVGLQQMVNSLGGLTICVRTPRHDVSSGDFLSAGVHHIDGKQALAFVRDREGLPLGDLDRVKDQRYLLSVMFHKVLSPGVLLNPGAMNGFLSALAHSLTVDRSLSLDDMRRLALRLRHIESVQSLTLPVANPSYFVDGQDAVELDMPAVRALFARLRSPAPPAAPAPAHRAVPAPPLAPTANANCGV
jgi:LCP family protein required for cell wall assembly